MLRFGRVLVAGPCRAGDQLLAVRWRLFGRVRSIGAGAWTLVPSAFFEGANTTRRRTPAKGMAAALGNAERLRQAVGVTAAARGAIGGSAGEVGSGHRAGAAALIVAHGLLEMDVPGLMPRSGGHPVLVRMETDDPTDDILCEYLDGRKAWIQAKRDITVGATGAGLEPVLRQWAAIVRRGTPRPGDGLVLAVARLSGPLDNLRSALNRRRDPHSGALTKQQHAAVTLVDGQLRHLAPDLAPNARAKLLDAAVIWHVDAGDAENVKIGHPATGRDVRAGAALLARLVVDPSLSGRAMAELTAAARTFAAQRSGAGLAQWREVLHTAGIPTAQTARTRPLPYVAVGSCRPEDVGIHRVDGEQPVYLARDHDRELRHRIEAAMADGGLVVVVGGSSTGKSRSVYEVVRDLSTDWRILPIDSPDSLRQASASISPRTFVWLDDTPTVRFLASGGITAADAQALIRREPGTGPIVVLYFVWPGSYRQMTRKPRGEPSGQDESRTARTVLGFAAGGPVWVPEQFSSTERHLAESSRAGQDTRLRLALADTRYGVTQHLAGAPRLMQQWRHATLAQPYGWAVLTAAADIRRLNLHVTLTDRLLHAVAPAYLTDAQFVDAPEDWFEAAIAYAEEDLGGKVSALYRRRGPALGSSDGYEMADYLQQQIIQERYYSLIPDVFWSKVIPFLEVEDVERLAYAASIRGQGERAEELYRRALPSLGSGQTPWWMVKRLVESGRAEELQALSASGDEEGRWGLLRLLLRQGHVEEAIALRDEYGLPPETDNWYDSVEDLDERHLRRLADMGDPAGGFFLAQRLDDQDRSDELRQLADAGHPIALSVLARVLERKGAVGEAEDVLDELCEFEGYDGPHQLAALLARHGREAELREWSAQGFEAATSVFLPSLLASEGRLDELRQMHETGDFPQNYWARIGIARVLAQQGREGELRNLLRESDDPSDDERATYYLADMLARQQRLPELDRLAAAGSRVARQILNRLLRQAGQENDLRRAACAGDRNARIHLVEMLAGQGRHKELREMVAAGDEAARRHLAGQRPQWS